MTKSKLLVGLSTTALFLSISFPAFATDATGSQLMKPREILKNARIIVEYYKQTKIEGEIQNIRGDVAHDELWEIVQGKKKGRRARDGIIVFDSVGFALADHAMLRMMYECVRGSNVALVPQPRNAKNLFREFRR
jgi:ornithine cyclodeaminase